eukprot:CAMPEP_0119117592 /NCGR_PEP_ID=MMETSP1180-20130426/52924_1 /TAXON_ID=3052 ORGANISM="Chlamydomonas cf sp, Strain CCMP681" /NCGR_SAMPLE_ID=MMETSP1180 /ASSEMBLY_ACC=CAM_ASM_000741 /LENGTH=61 /DNA_ID=CAMNT_0007106867 /DNA_START=1297 /DNA_END=1482 /DNA_ORIENTATION=+
MQEPDNHKTEICLGSTIVWETNTVISKEIVVGEVSDDLLSDPVSTYVLHTTKTQQHGLGHG